MVFRTGPTFDDYLELAFSYARPLEVLNTFPDRLLLLIVQDTKELADTFKRLDMGIVGVGTDILQLSRLVALGTRRGLMRLSNRILTRKERELFRSIPLEEDERRTQFLAVR